jgi:hypothetical protein
MSTTKIYLVENCYNDPNKVYIGKTKNSREEFHKRIFGDQIKYNYIDEVDSLDYKDWEPLETYWIEQFRQWGFKVMNIRKKGGSGPEFYTEDICKKISKNRNHKKASEKLQKVVIQYDLQGNIIKKWKSIKEASLFYNIKSGDISCCCSEKQKTAGGFRWQFENIPLSLYITHDNSKAVYQCDKNRNIIKEWKSSKQAAEALGIDQGNIITCIKGRQKTSGGFIWINKI